ncbi:MAG TPA: DUF3592 domain-containing protein [Lacunisphaera sp.]|nr:DUF3592 domain-containing protein [Lacunisphaera sp.]
MTPALLFGLASLGSFALAVILSQETRRKKQAVPRMVVTTGVVRELATVITDRRAWHVRSQTIVEVDFRVRDQAYVCRTLHLFLGNRHVGDVGKKYDFPPGQQVGVHYDPSNPNLNALVLDQPRQEGAVIAVVLGVLFAVMAVVKGA